MEKTSFDVMMEKLDVLRDEMGSWELLDEMARWFSTQQMNECLDDIANTWDIQLDQ